MRWRVLRLAVANLAFSGLALSAPAYAEQETLEQAWGMVYQINPSLQATRAELRALDEQVAQAQSHWRPSLDATANIGKNYQYTPAQKPEGTSDFADTSRGYGVQLTQPLFRGFRTDSETEAAEKQVLAGRAKLNDAEQQVFIDTATAFLDILRDQQILDIQHNNEDVLQQKLVETQVRYNAGELTQTDVHQAESRLARTHVSRFQAENSLSQDRAAYTRLVGKAPEALQEPHIDAPVIGRVDDILHLAETRNPKVMEAQYSVDQAHAEVDLNKGSLLPEINLVGNAGRNWGQASTLPGEEDTSQIMVQLTMPLYRSGADYSKSRAAEQTVTQRRMELEEARYKAHETANNAWRAYITAQAALDADIDEVRATKLALDGVKEESKVGTRTTLDVLNAQQELLDARVDEVKSQHDRDLALLQIKNAMGDLTAERLELKVKSYNPERHYNDVRNKWVGFSRDDSRYGADDSAAYP